MVNLPLEVQTILFAFTLLFSMPVWQNACMLSVGAILSIGKRTAASALKVMGLKDEKHFTNCHQVLNMDEWNALNGAEILQGLIKREPEPEKGNKQPSLLDRINDPLTNWKPLTIVWYVGIKISKLITQNSILKIGLSNYNAKHQNYFSKT
ncbi:MAG: hypothetical protein DRJ64_09025 [Thermoprotei archaeon]|nr:MAG: hypothetical protein DRJ64_09025 [Thermoprotei archaeon]